VAGGVIDLAGDQLRNVPIWFFAGEKDVVCPANASRQMYEQLTSRGAREIKMTVIPGADHLDMYREGLLSTETYHWLLQHRLPN
jgi:dipeptidyl aminopeptidase/acylaminoacyl peptidase